MERAQTSKNAPASDGGVKIEQIPAETINEAQRVENAGEASLRHDLVATEDGKVFVKASRNVISGTNRADWKEQISDFFRALLGDGREMDVPTIEGDTLTITWDETAYKARDDYKQINRAKMQMSDTEFRVKLNAEAHIEELAEAATINSRESRQDEKGHGFAKDGFVYRTAYFQDFDGQYYKLKISIGKNGNTATVYNVGQIKEDVPPSAKIIAVAGSRPLQRTSSDTIIDENQEKSTPSGENVSENVSDNAPEGASDNDSKRSALPKTREAKERKRKRAQEHQRQSREKRKAERMAEAMREEVVRNAEQNAEVNAEQGTEAAQETVEKAKIPARGYTDAEANDARALVKDFDLLPASTRRAIVELMRSGKASGASKNFLRHSANLIAYWRKGLWIIADDKTRDDGFYYVLDDGTRLITVNPKREAKAVSETLMHELAHDVWARADAKIRKTLYDLATAGVDQKEIEEIRERYRTELTNRGELTKRDADGNAVDMTDAEINALLDEEVATNLLGETIGTEEFLSRFNGEGKFAAAKRIWRTLYNMKKRFTGKDKYLYRKADDLFKQFTKVMAVEEVEGGTAEPGKRHMFVGRSAETADKLKLSTAQEMLDQGIDSETVRKETGWFRGYDGKWRFEIDDSQVEIAFNGRYSRDPEIHRYAELVDKVYFAATATESEQNELVDLDKKLGDRNITPNKLGDVIHHPTLFEAYPQLKDIGIRFVDGLGDTRGSWDAQLNEIVISKSLKRDQKQVKKTLIHEIQHAIQYFEGFASGSSPEYWVVNPMYGEEGNERLRAAEKKLDDVYASFHRLWNDDVNWSLAKEYKRLQELHWESPNVEYYEKKLADIEAAADEAGWGDLLDEYLGADAQYELARKSAKKVSPQELYKRTAGEIEARDAANRSELSTEQRKNTRPDIDREDVVFAESGDRSLSIAIAENGKPVVVVNDDITRYASNDKELVQLVKQSIGKLPYVAIGRQKIKFLYDTKREVTFSKYTQWLRKTAPDIYRDKMRLFNHPSEIILATTNYINEGLRHPRTDDIIDFARGELLVDILGNQYTAEVVIGFTKAGVCELHDVVKMVPTSFKYKTRDALSAISHGGEPSQKRSSLNNSIPQNSQKSTTSSKKVQENNGTKRNALPKKPKSQTTEKKARLTKEEKADEYKKVMDTIDESEGGYHTRLDYQKISEALDRRAREKAKAQAKSKTKRPPEDEITRENFEKAVAAERERLEREAAVTNERIELDAKSLLQNRRLFARFKEYE